MLIWIDLEMTGLEPTRDYILEIASLITTDDLQILAEGPHRVIHQPESCLTIMEEPVSSMHQSNGLTNEVRKSKISLDQAYSETIEFIKANVPKPYTSPLCGNTVWKDREFLKAYMPEIHEHLHYRCLDVSTLKELAKRWVGKDFVKNGPKKSKSHRANEDILCSVEELKYYRENLFNLSILV